MQLMHAPAWIWEGHLPGARPRAAAAQAHALDRLGSHALDAGGSLEACADAGGWNLALRWTGRAGSLAPWAGLLASTVPHGPAGRLSGTCLDSYEAAEMTLSRRAGARVQPLAWQMGAPAPCLAPPAPADPSGAWAAEGRIDLFGASGRAGQALGGAQAAVGRDGGELQIAALAGPYDTERYGLHALSSGWPGGLAAGAFDLAGMLDPEGEGLDVTFRSLQRLEVLRATVISGRLCISEGSLQAAGRPVPAARAA